jgi:rRNA-processing protein FCF1
METYNRGLQLFRKGEYSDALQFLKTVTEIGKESIIPSIFYSGFCYLKCGQKSKADNLFLAVEIRIKDPKTRILVSNLIKQLPNYTDPIKVIEDFEAALSGLSKPVEPPPLQKDSVILDANFIIKTYVYDNTRFQKLMKKMHRRYNLYTTQNVYQEILPLGYRTPEYKKVQKLLSETITRINIDNNAIDTLEHIILTKFQHGQSIKQTHMNRLQAWTNDLSLICLLKQLESPVKYIVTNDQGLQSIVQFLYPNKDTAYYLRSLTDFIASINILIQTGNKPYWEEMIYET